MKDLKVVFMGTPSFSIPVLEALIKNCNVLAVVTQPDKKVGRDEVLKASPTKELALQHSIEVIQPVKIKNDFQSILDLNPDIIVTCAYGQIIPKEILEYPRLGCINVHASLLPKLRGGAPIHRAIIDGYEKTGVTIMYMVEKMDAGDIISQREIEISNEDTAGSLHDKLSILGRDLLLDTLPDIIGGNVNRIKQETSEVTYGWNISREDEKIDFSKTKREIYNLIRGLNPWPGAYAIIEAKTYKVWASRIGENYYTSKINGEIVKLYEDGIGVKVSNGEIILTEIQAEGKKKMTVKEFLNGIQDKDQLIGKVFE